MYTKEQALILFRLTNPERWTTLERGWNVIRLQSDGVQHQWLCHPGEACEDGCDLRPLRERQEAVDNVEFFLREQKRVNREVG